MFKDIFGNNPQTKILDFLASHIDFDYSITDIAKYSKVSKPTVYKVIDTLIEKKLIIITREIGKSSMYKLNTGNPLVKKILRLELEIGKHIADLEADKQVQRYDKVLRKHTSKTTA